MQAGPISNWAGNYRYAAPRLRSPASVEELLLLVRNSRHIKALGSRHSFNSIADTADTQISLARFNTIQIDAVGQTVTIGAGIRYGELAPVLQARGLALHNLASLPHISVAGAIATATHGSGLHCGNLATRVSAVEFISGSGEWVRLSRSSNPDVFPGAVVSLGALGIATAITLDVEPAYEVAQTVYLDLPFAVLQHHLTDILSAGYSVSLFTDWRNDRATQIWIKRRMDRSYASKPDQEFYGAQRSEAKVHPIANHAAAACTDQLGVPGPWFERLPHFRMDFTPSSGDELQSEYFVPIEHGYAAVSALRKLAPHIAPHLLVSELRAVAADDLWLSMACERAALAIHFTWKPDWAAVRSLLPQIEQQLAPFAARPHWGKLFTTPAEQFVALYPHMDRFRRLAARYDPAGKLRNSFLNNSIFA